MTSRSVFTNLGSPPWAFLMRSSVALFVGILTTSTFSIPGMTRNSQPSIELYRLIQMYMIPKGFNHNVLEWDSGGAPETPISWQHAGIKDCDAFVLGKELNQPFCRIGKVVITIGGRPTHKILSRMVEPGQWNIVLAGARAGVSYVILDSNVLSHELSSGLLRIAVSQTGSTIQVNRISACGSLTGGSEQLSVSAPGKETALVREWWTCGSAGCNIKMTFAPIKGNAGELMRCAP